MKLIAAVLCVALGAAWASPARAEEIRPNFEGLELGKDAAHTYELNAIGIVHHEVSGSFPFFYTGRDKWWRPVRGKFNWATKYDDFYFKMGRPDLGDRDRRRGVLSTTLSVAGLLVMVGGVVVVFTDFISDRNTRFGVALGMVGGGVVLGAIGSNIGPPLVSEEDAAAMAKEYNRRLQVHLGLSPMAADAGRPRLPVGLTLTRRW
jgi:hypothetical protein